MTRAEALAARIREHVHGLPGACQIGDIGGDAVRELAYVFAQDDDLRILFAAEVMEARAMLLLEEVPLKVSEPSPPCVHCGNTESWHRQHNPRHQFKPDR